MADRSRRRLSVRVPQLVAELDISDVHKRAVERALRWAWLEVGKRWPNVLQTGTEEQITAKVQRVLNEQTATHRRAAPGLRSFETVNRGSKVESSDGRIELMPDLVFRPPIVPGVRDRSDWGYFVECKIIDGTKLAGLYCTEGVARFVRGEYAPRMPSGGMLAYVRDRSEPFATLQARFSTDFSTRTHVQRTVDLSESVHARDALPTPCVAIALVHLWLCV